MSKPAIRPQRKVSRRILAFRVIVVLLVTLISSEIALRVGFAVFRPDLNVQSLTVQQVDVMYDNITERQNARPNVLHPYVGSVLDPTRNPKSNMYGFWQIDGPLLKRSPNTVIVGITGGSVARDLCTFSAETIRNGLSLRLPGKEIRIVCLAQEGFREPQLAMTLAYFQTLGAEFDVIVSLSGFNEAALHPAESHEDALWVGYPRDWDLRLRDTEDHDVNRLILEGQTTQMKRTAWAARANQFRNIPLLTIHGIWFAIDSAYKTKTYEIATQLMASRHRTVNRYANLGPSVRYDSPETRRAAQCDMWCGGARQLHRMCRTTDAKFLLCLQPNLHEGSVKVLTEEEAKIKRIGTPYRQWVENNYPYFAAAGVALRTEGIAFFDLRQLYDDVSSTIYRDECCHFNQGGNDLLANRIAELIEGELKAQDPAD